MKRVHIYVLAAATLAAVALYSPGSKEYDLPGLYSRDSVVASVMHYTQRNYVDKDAIDPMRMLHEGLNKLEQRVDEVLVTYPQGEDGPYFMLTVLDERRKFDQRHVTDLFTVGDTIDEVLSFVFDKLGPTLGDDEPKEIEHEVLDAMLKTLDPHSALIPPKIYKEFMIETEGSFGGLGIVIGIRNGKLTVISPIEGTPAYRAGIKPNDVIVQIENESTVNMSLIEAVSKLRGPKGTAVNINIMRKGFSSAKPFRIVRDTIKIESVESFDLGDGIGYLRIRDFQKNTLDSIEQQIGELTKRHPLKGLIIDLRGNPGGLLDQAERIADLFLSRGVIVTTRVGDRARSFRARPSPEDLNAAVVVLVDSGSASASEIVAGALKNNDRAVVVGQRTFGKGSVQQIFDLKDGSALKLTIADYLTPGDVSIQDVGIMPDIRVLPVTLGEDSVNITLPSLLDSGGERRKPPQEKPLYTLLYVNAPDGAGEESEVPEEALSRKQKRKRLEGDFFVKVAKRLLLASHGRTRSAALREGRRAVVTLEKAEEQKIVGALAKKGLDWSVGPRGEGTASVELRVVPERLSFNAGQKAEITLEAVNTGTATLWRVVGVTESENRLFNGREFLFGRLDPGQRRSWTIKVDVPPSTLTRNDLVTVKLTDHYGNRLPDYRFTVDITSAPRPVFAYNYQILDDGTLGSKGDGDGVAETGERIVLLLRVKNEGRGPARKTVVALKNLSGDAVFLSRGRFEYEEFPAGSTVEAPLSFTVQHPEPELRFQLSVVDDVLREGIVKEIHIPTSSGNAEAPLAAAPPYVVANLSPTPLYGGSYPSSPVVGYVSAGTVMRASGKNGHRVKVAAAGEGAYWVDQGSVSYVKEPQVAEATRQPRLVDEFYDPPVITVDPLPTVTTAKEIEIRGRVEDDEGIKLVSLFVGDDKVKLFNGASSTRLPFRAKIKLEEGINYITVVAKNADGLGIRRNFVVRREGA